MRVYLPYLLLISYLSVGFVPYLGALDKYATQYLFVSILNLISIVYIFFEFDIRTIFKKSIFLLYILFFIWGLLSYSQALNKTEVIVSSSRILVYLFTLFNLFFLQKKIKNLFQTICVIFTAILAVEVVYIFLGFIELFENGNFNRTRELRGFTGNINIAAFSILLKIPFTFHLLNKIKKYKYVIGLTFYFIIFFTLFTLGSRGANILIVLLLIAYSIFNLLFLKGDKKSSIIVISSFLISIFFNSLLLSESNINFTKRTVNIKTQSSSDRLRYYSQAWATTLENPIFGIGLGNWKIHSIKMDMKNIRNYIVPYHVHNDFLQFSAEIGFTGLIFYLMIFITALLKIYKNFDFGIKSDKNFFLLSVFLAISVYFFDSLLNFPFTRPIVYMPVICSLAVIMNLSKKENE